MNKQLLIALFAATFSGITFTTEAPDNTVSPQELHEYCTAYNTKNCLEMLALAKTVTEAMQSEGRTEPTQEENEKGEALHNALLEEIQQFNARKTNLLESAEQKAENAAQDLSEKLNPTDSTDSKE